MTRSQNTARKGKAKAKTGATGTTRTTAQIAQENAAIDTTKCYVGRLPNELLIAVIATHIDSPWFNEWSDERQARRRTLGYVNKAWRRACKAISYRHITIRNRNREDFAQLHETLTTVREDRALEIQSFRFEVEKSTETERKQLVEVLSLATNLRTVALRSPFLRALEPELLSDAVSELLGRSGLQEIDASRTAVDGERFKRHLEINPGLRKFSFLGVSGQRVADESGAQTWSIEGQPAGASIIAAIGPEISDLSLADSVNTTQSLAQISRCAKLLDLEVEVPANGSDAYLAQLRTAIRPLALRHLGLTLTGGGVVPSEATAAMMSEFMAKPTFKQLTFRGPESPMEDAQWRIKPADVQSVLEGLTRTDHDRRLTIGEAVTGDTEDDDVWEAYDAEDLVELAESRNVELEIYA